MDTVIMNATSSLSIAGTATAVSYTLPVFVIVLISGIILSTLYVFNPKFRKFMDGFWVYANETILTGAIVSGFIVGLSVGAYLLYTTLTDKHVQENFLRPLMGIAFVLIGLAALLGLIGGVSKLIWEKIGELLGARPKKKKM